RPTTDPISPLSNSQTSIRPIPHIESPAWRQTTGPISPLPASPQATSPQVPPPVTGRKFRPKQRPKQEPTDRTSMKEKRETLASYRLCICPPNQKRVRTRYDSNQRDSMYAQIFDLGPKNGLCNSMNPSLAAVNSSSTKSTGEGGAVALVFGTAKDDDDEI